MSEELGTEWFARDVHARPGVVTITLCNKRNAEWLIRMLPESDGFTQDLRAEADNAWNHE